MSADLSKAVSAALTRLRWGFGIWGPDEKDAKEAIFNEAVNRLTAFGATPDEVEKAIDWKGCRWDNEPNKPRALSGIYLYGIVREYRHVMQKKHEPEPESRALTDNEFSEFVDYCFEAYQAGGQKWSIVRAGGAWVADRLGLDWSKNLVKATEKHKAERLSEARGMGLILEQAAIAANQNAVEAEAKRMALQEYFRSRYDSERSNATDNQVFEQPTEDASLEEHDGPGPGSEVHGQKGRG